MARTKSDLLLHPVRMRIMTELAGRRMSPGQLATTLPDVAQATLYRHIKQLQENGIIEVVEETAVNGATERTFAVAAGQGRLTDDDLQGVTPAEHKHYFATFAASLIDAFSRYVDQADLPNMGADGASYNRAVIYLSDSEKEQFQTDIVNLLQAVMQNNPSPQRKRFTLASIVIPDERSQ